MTPDQFLLVADVLPEPMLLVSSKGCILVGNRAVSARLHLDPQTLRGVNLADLVADPTEELAHYLRLCSRSRQLVLGGMGFHSPAGVLNFRIEGMVVRPAVDGADALLLLRVLPKEGTVRQFVALNQEIEKLSREIQRRRQAEHEARQQEERWRVTLQSIGDGVISTDLEGRVEWLNPIAEALTGWKNEEASEQMLEEVFRIVNEKTYLPVENPARRALQEGTIVGLANQTILIAKDGSERLLDDCAAPIRDGRGELCGAVLIFRDITERRRLEEQLRQARMMEAIGRLAGGIAHDFNNIMTIITGFGEVLLTNDLSVDQQRTFFRNILDAGKRATALTQQILAFSRKQMLAPRVVNLNALLSDLATLTQRLVGEQIELSTELDPDLGLVEVDPTQLGQVVLNLAANARDAMPTGGRLMLSTANAELDEETTRLHAELKPGPYARLTVSDTGTGMDEETLSHLFEPFFTTKEFGKGSGLGLASVYGIIKQSGGHIEVASKIGKGTTFHIYLPLIAQFVPSTAGEAEGRSPRGSETILLVEDEPGVRSMTRLVLEQNGYTVLEASNGLEGIEVAKRHAGPIHLLITDLMMPKLSGRELADRLTALLPKLRILFMSGYSNEEEAPRQAGSGELLFLPKPFSLTALMRKVREALDQP